MKRQIILNHLQKIQPHLISYFMKGMALVTFLIILIAGGALIYKSFLEHKKVVDEQANTVLLKTQLEQQLASVSAQLQTTTDELIILKAEDQVIKNKNLEEEIKNIQTNFRQAVTQYEEILDLRGDGAKTQGVEAEFSKALSLLAKRNYKDAAITLQKLTNDIQILKTQLASSGGAIPADLKTSNSPPGSGYSKQVVEADGSQFVVDILAADLNSTRVQVETASAGDCADNCPVSSLADFVARSGGFAGINGPYFCPAEYPSCAGKTNSFDTLIMNKNKVYFNSDNNVYSTVPVMIFSGNSVRLAKSSEWGRDTGADAVIAGQPALIWGGEVAFGGDGDPKKGSRGSRCFIAVKGNTVYIGVVRSATVAEAARVLKTLGMQSALNLDSGGSTAFLVNGKYVAGPGRQTPFGIVLVRR